MNELDEALDALHREERHAPAPLAEARVALLAAIDAETARKPRRLIWTLATAAAAVLALTAVFVIPRHNTETVAGQGTQPVQLLSATEVLDLAARHSVRAADPAVAAGQFRYLDEHVWNLRGTELTRPGGPREGYSWLIQQRYQTWIPADYTQTWLNRRTWLGGEKWLGGSMPRAQAQPPRPLDTDAGDRSGACGDFFPLAKPKKVCGDPNDIASPTFYARLPHDPDALYALIQNAAKVKGGSPGTQFQYGLVVLEEGLMPADLRADWYRALAKIPGVTVLDRAANLDGRTGTALGFKDANESRELIIDPASGEYIGQRTVAGDQPYEPWIKPGTVTAYSSITIGVADRLGAEPGH